ncbi:MAG: phospholipase D family protein [Nannocystaceae bacterium]
MDFALPARPIKMRLISGRGHYETVVAAVLKAQRSVWVATANLKQMMVEGRRVSVRSKTRFRSVLDVFDELAAAGVELRILHASRPSGPFRERFDALPRLFEGGLELRECPRVHLKAVVVDGALVYLGSANWTGAGLGAKGEGRRNFEVGILTDDDEVLDTIQELYDRIWRGAECAACRLRDGGCEAPLDLFSAERVVTASQRARLSAAATQVPSKPTRGRRAKRATTAKRATKKRGAAKESAATTRTAAARGAMKEAPAKKSAAKGARTAAAKGGAKEATAKKSAAKGARTAAAKGGAKEATAKKSAAKGTASTTSTTAAKGATKRPATTKAGEPVSETPT